MRHLKRALALVLLAAALLAWLPPRADAAAAPSATSRDPVIFVPGIAGTELYNNNDLVWINTWRLLGRQVPILNLFEMGWLMPLRLTPDGTSPYYASSHVHTGDIMRHNLTDIYSDMLHMLSEQGYVEGQSLFLFPYDWRQDLTVTAGQLGQEVDRVLAQTKARKVVLLSHSMGGLIARDYIVRGGAPHVKASITMATPWLGAPMAYKALNYGWDLGLKLPGTKWSALAPKDVKLLTQNFPSAYELAPSHQYFDFYTDGYLNRGGQNLNFAASVAQGLEPHNRVLADRVDGFYNQLLDGSDHGVMQFVLAGNGRSTLSGITERRGLLGIPQKTERTTDGDEVVPLLSADLGYSQNPRRITQYLGHVAAVAYAGESHTFFTEAPAVQTIVKGWLAQVQGR